MFGHLLLPMHYGGRLLLGGTVRATVVVDSSMPVPYSQDLSCLVWFVWNLRLAREEVAFYLGLSLTRTAACYPHGHTKIK